MTQTQADRQAAAQKAATTRKENEARENVSDAKSSTGAAADDIEKAARALGDAAANFGKAVLSRAKSVGR